MVYRGHRRCLRREGTTHLTFIDRANDPGHQGWPWQCFDVNQCRGLLLILPSRLEAAMRRRYENLSRGDGLAPYHRGYVHPGSDRPFEKYGGVIGGCYKLRRDVFSSVA
jgi:hypothetical protein